MKCEKPFLILEDSFADTLDCTHLRTNLDTFVILLFIQSHCFLLRCEFSARTGPSMTRVPLRDSCDRFLLF